MALHMHVSQPLASHGHKRVEARARVAIEARLQTVLGNASAYLLNLSCHGAMVQTEKLPQRGSDVVLKCGPLDALGIVAWVSNEHFGLEFDEPVAEHLVIELRCIADEAAQHKAHQRLGRPALATRALTEEEWQVAQEWAVSNNFR